jgi:hypothetical protein
LMIGELLRASSSLAMATLRFMLAFGLWRYQTLLLSSQRLFQSFGQQLVSGLAYMSRVVRVMGSIRIWLIIGLVTALSYLGYMTYQKIDLGGYNRAQVEFQEALDKVNKQHAIELQVKQKEVSAAELKYLNYSQEVVTVYKDKVVNVIEEVTKYVKDTDASNCNVGPHGMQLINEALSGKKTSSSTE